MSSAILTWFLATSLQIQSALILVRAHLLNLTVQTMGGERHRNLAPWDNINRCPSLLTIKFCFNLFMYTIFFSLGQHEHDHLTSVRV